MTSKIDWSLIDLAVALLLACILPSSIALTNQETGQSGLEQCKNTSRNTY